MGSNNSTNITDSLNDEDDTAAIAEYDVTDLERIDLFTFEKYYIETLLHKYLQKPKKIYNPDTVFIDDQNIFLGLKPWTSASDLDVFLKTLIGYGVRFRNPSDSLYLNPELAFNLYVSILQLYNRLPFPALVDEVPWGTQDDWYVFSITMLECLQHTCIVLKGYYNLDNVCIAIFDAYLPSPTFSMGRRRNDDDVVRMCLPYCYGQLLRGLTFDEIATQVEVQYVLNLISQSLVESGKGIHYDYVYFDDSNVRNYNSLIYLYYTFSYYNFMFGDDTVNMSNLYNSFSLISNSSGLTNPAIVDANDCVAYFIDYPNGVFSADNSKILTIRNDKYFASALGMSSKLINITSNPMQTILYAMFRKIWSTNNTVIQYRPAMLPLESGVLTIDKSESNYSENQKTKSMLTSTGICKTDNAGLMATHVRSEELNLEFYSYSLYHRYGMFQLYDKIKSLSRLSYNATCIVLSKDTKQNIGETKWTAAFNIKSHNGITAKYHNIINVATLPNFVLKNHDTIGAQTIEQNISHELVNQGVGVACFSLLAHDTTEHDTTTISKLDQKAFIVSTNDNSIQVVIAFPIIILKDVESRQISINNVVSESNNLHKLDFDEIEQPLSYLSLTISNLNSNYITKTEYSFYFESSQTNQFKFSF
ncbi:Odv-e66 [Apocheima cinerarium nucleopolyhedrovirus]|uniref:Odv-e66 n=1 Tax=Apocheima cinerarium nucleopolyhedrovirus TaxID=307461 RepID=UPI0001D92040|nr:Odv-e66 [Apocheima cinerarium nucleopolyhedrovirus]ADB84372.1 Odv-e66 [Apocheima cinerarium nucleopolyhedrovirus]